METDGSTLPLLPRSHSPDSAHQNNLPLIRSGNFQHYVQTPYLQDPVISQEETSYYREQESISQKDQSDNNDKTSSNRVEKEEKKFKFSSLPRRKKYMLVFCTFTNFLEGCGFSIMAPFFPREAETKGMSIMLISFVFSIFELVIFITSPFFGSYLTTLGPKFVVLSGTFVGGICTILFGILEHCPPGTPFIVISLVCRTVGAVGFSALLNSIMALLAIEFPDNVASCVALLETSYGIGTMIGPAIGGALYELGGFGMPFYVVGCLVLFKGTLVFAVIPKVDAVSQKKKVSKLSLMRSPMVVIPMISIAVGCMGIIFIEPTLANHLESFNLSIGVTSLFFVIAPGLFTLTSPFWGFLTDSRENSYPYLIVIGQFIYGVGFLLLGPSELLPFLSYEMWTIILGLVVIGGAFGCCLIPHSKCMILGAVDIGYEVNLETYALVTGLLYSMYSLGAFIGPMLGGILVQEMGFSWGSTAIGLLNILMCVITFIFFTIRSKSQANKDSLERNTDV